MIFTWKSWVLPLAHPVAFIMLTVLQKEYKITPASFIVFIHYAIHIQGLVPVKVICNSYCYAYV